MISSHHAIIRKSNEILEIEDINSLNGVFINGKKVTKSRITYDDVINLGIYHLRLSEQKIIRAYEYDNRIDLVNLSFAVNDKGNQKVIINDISLSRFFLYSSYFCFSFSIFSCITESIIPIS